MNPVTPGVKPQTPSRSRRRLKNHLRTVFARGDFGSLLITWGIMIVTGMALDAAEWTDGLHTLVYVNIFAVGFGFLLSRSHYSELFALIMSSVYAMGAILLINATLLIDSGSVWYRTDTLLRQLWLWFNDATVGDQPRYDDVAFVVFLSILFWYLGHNAAWHVFRVDRVWRVIIPTGMVIITNQFYYQGDNSLDIYLIAFVVLSLLLLIRSHIETREYDWFIHRISFPNYVRRAFFYAGGALAIVLVIAAWSAPTGHDDKSLDRVKELLSGEKFNEWAELWNRLFSSLEAQGVATADYYGGDELQLSGAIQLGDQPVMYVQVPFGPRYYWRSTVYDSYDAADWRWRHIRTVRAYTDEAGLQLNTGTLLPGVRREVNQTVTLLLRTSKLIYAAPQPVQFGLPVEVELDCVDDFQRDCVNENREADIAIVRARSTLRSGDSYTVASSVSAASAGALRQAGENYPSWVLRLYLQGANNVSPRVRALAAEIVAQAGAQTSYDRTKAIETWLRTYIQYNESIPAPPRGSDPIEWFLFETRQGYCNYYATAMIMMLRSQGIPARMAAGFAQGTWDPERSAFLVRERDAHTWVEVYFPGYGWVEFEPTADEAPIERQDEQQPMTVLPTVTPPPTPTPLPTATMTPGAPTEESGANATPTSPSESPFLPSTPTPTPTPAPTATVPPPPDPTRIGGGTDSNILSTILLVLGIIALIITGLIITGLFLIWYVEYRGLGGLNVIQRAYARMAIYARWLGLYLADTSTPDERRRALVNSLPEGEMPINAITHAYIENRYGDPHRIEEDDFSAEVANSAWQDARWVFIREKLRGIFRRR